MMGRTLVATALFVFTAGPAVAQDALDRVVGPDASGGPLEFRAFTTHELGAFSRSAHVPVGFEALPAPRNSATFRPIVLTGLSVRDAAAAMVARDARYAWREDDGVIVFEPVEPLVPQPLDAPAPAVRLGETTAREAFGVAAALLGAPRSTSIDFSDTKPFVLDAPEGTIRSLLDAIVRSHGEVVWVLERSVNRDGLFPFTLLFLSGPHGWGLGLSGRPTEPLDLSRFTRRTATTSSVLDTIVGPRRDGFPLVLAGMWSAPVDLAAATGTPFGMQIAAGPLPTPHSREFTATGSTLRAVLDRLVAQDSRYEWRLIDGTIVIRPSRAWGDGADPLFALVRDVQLENATMTEAVRAVASALGAAQPVLMTFPDSKTVSLAVFHGTALELLTALAKAHGSLTWTFVEAEDKEVAATGLTHRLTLGVAGGAGYGFLVRIGRATGGPSSR